LKEFGTTAAETKLEEKRSIISDRTMIKSGLDLFSNIIIASCLFLFSAGADVA
jgi:hypothetical protein